MLRLGRFHIGALLKVRLSIIRERNDLGSLSKSLFLFAESFKEYLSSLKVVRDVIILSEVFAA